MIPTYNRAALLIESVNSVLAQTYPNLEVIVVDDCSTDDTEGVMAEIVKCDPRVRFYRQSANSGANAARNKGWSISKGEFLCFLDSDDLFRPDKIQKQVESLQSRPEADACVCQIAIFYDKPGDSPKAWNRLEGDHPLLRYAANDVVWGTAAPLWRRQTLDRIGAWDESIPFHQDLDYHLRALALGVTFLLIPNVLEDYRDSHDGTITAGSKRRKDGLKVQLDIYERAEKMARDRGAFDESLGRAFATTYVWCAIVAARMKEWPQIWRAMAAARRVDPSRARQIAVQPFLALAAPAIYAVGTGAKPLVDNLNLIGLNWHRWHFNHTLEEVEGKTYHGGGVEGFADSYGSTVEQPPANN